MTPDAARRSLRNQIDQHGDAILVRRYSGNPGARTATDYATRGRPYERRTVELAGNVKESRCKVILMIEDLERTAIALPLVKTDRLVVDGREMAIEDLDDKTRRLAGVLIAYDLTVRG